MFSKWARAFWFFGWAAHRLFIAVIGASVVVSLVVKHVRGLSCPVACGILVPQLQDQTHVPYIGRGNHWCACVLGRFSCVWLCATLWAVAHQAPLSMGFSRQEYWSGLPCPTPGDLPNPGIKSMSLTFLHWQKGSLPLAPSGKPDTSTSQVR